MLNRFFTCLICNQLLFISITSDMYTSLWMNGYLYRTFFFVRRMRYLTLKLVSTFRLGYGVSSETCRIVNASYRSSRLSKMYEKFAHIFAKFLPRDYVTRIEEIGTCSQNVPNVYAVWRGKTLLISYPMYSDENVLWIEFE